MKILKFILLGFLISAGGDVLFAAAATPPRTPTKGAAAEAMPDSPAKVDADSAFTAEAIEVIRENYQACLEKGMISSPVRYLDLICDDILHLDLSQRQLYTAARMIQAIVTGHVFRVDPFRVANEAEKQIYLKAVQFMHKIFTRKIESRGKAAFKLDSDKIIMSPPRSDRNLEAHLKVLRDYNSFLNATALLDIKAHIDHLILEHQITRHPPEYKKDIDTKRHSRNNHKLAFTGSSNTKEGMVSLPLVVQYNMPKKKGFLRTGDYEFDPKLTVHGFAQLLGITSPK